MTWLESLRATAPRAATLESPSMPLTSEALVDLMVGPKVDAGVSVSEKAALGLPAVYRAVALIAGTCGGLPLHAYSDQGGTHKRLPEQPAIIASPHPDMTPFEWTELVYVHLLTWGNAYLRVLRDQSGRVVELWPIDPWRVRVGRDSVDARKWYTVDGAQGTPYSDRQILHIPGMGYDGTVGMSPIQVARQAFGTAIATQRYGGRFFGAGSMLSGVLSTEQKLTPAQADEAKARWKVSHGGPDNAHDIAVLGAGTKFQPISVSPVDAQFIEQQRFGVVEVARMFGVPPHLLMDVTGSTSWGTGISEQSLGFVRYTLRPWLIRVEQRMTKLLTDPQYATGPATSGRYARFNVEGLLRGDTKERYEAHTLGRNGGWLSVNDIRAVEDMPAIDGGDSYIQPLNMGTLGAEPAPATEGA